MPAAFDDVSRFVVVPSTEQASATAIDADADQIVGDLPLGIVLRQVLISRTEAKLVATNGIDAGFTTTDLASAGVSRVALPHVVDRLVLGTSGWLLAAADMTGGVITFFDLRRGIVMGRIDGLPRLRDLMFVNQDAALFVVAEGWAGATATARSMR